MIYLGDGSYGVEAAAETYFGEPVSKLTVAQDAVIAAIIQAPSTYYLPQYRTNLETRWHYVLNGMVKIGDLTQAQADSMTFPKLLTDKPAYTPPGLSTGCSTTSTEPWASYLMTQVCSELTSPVSAGGEGVSQNQLDNGGLKVVTTISLPMEEEMYKAVNENIAQMPQTEANWSHRRSSLPSWALVGAELQDPKTGAILAEYPGRGQNMSPKKCKLYDCDDNTATLDPRAGRVVVQAVRAGDRRVAGHERPEQHPEHEPVHLRRAGRVTPMSYSEAIPAACTTSRARTLAARTQARDKVENDGGEVIGKPVGPKGRQPVGRPTCRTRSRSPRTPAFTDLAHRATTANIIQMASSSASTSMTIPTARA